MPTKKSNLREKARDAYESGKEKTVAAKDKTEDFIKENPWKAIAIAAGVGALVALGVNALHQRRSYEPSFWEKFRDYFY